MLTKESLSDSENRKAREEAKKSIYREIQILLRLKHPNVIELCGVISKPLGLLVEFMECGNLFHY